MGKKIIATNPDEKKRHIMRIFLILIICVIFTGCSTNVETTSNSDGTAVSIIGGSNGPTSVFIAGKIGDKEEGEMGFYINNEEIPVIWEDNDTVSELFEQAKTEPIEIKMSMYGGNEQVGALGKSYTKNDTQITTENGDIVLYSGNQLVVFYAPNTWSYTKLGKIDLPEDAVTALLSQGDVVISIRGE